MLNTVYPGARRSAGMAQPFEILFGAPGLGVLTKTNPVVSNSSEISTSFTVSFVWALALLLGARGFGRLRKHLVELVIGAFGALWLIWAAVNTGSLGARIHILNLIPPARAAQVVGILGIILVCLLLARRTLAGTLSNT